MDDYMNNDQYNVFLENIAKSLKQTQRPLKKPHRSCGIPKCRNKKGFSPTPTKAKRKAK